MSCTQNPSCLASSNLVVCGLDAQLLLRLLVFEVVLLGLDAHVLLERAAGCPVPGQVLVGEREGNVRRSLWTKRLNVQVAVATDN